MGDIQFNESEMNVVETLPVFPPWSYPLDVYNTPATDAEAVKATFARKPLWQICNVETAIFTPRIYPDNVARAWVFENRPFDPVAEGGGPDQFGVEWIYIESAGGSMEKAGCERFDDVNDWRDHVEFPDVDSWDWEGSAAENNDTYLADDKYHAVWIQTGFFERLISFMGFEDALVAMIDDEQEDAIKDFMDAMADHYINIVDHFDKYFRNIGGFYVHDDWSSAQNSFFPSDTVEELIVPAMRKLTDHIHELGYCAEMHSCGMGHNMVPNMIKAGWDAWQPQEIVDTRAVWEKYGDQILIGVYPDIMTLPEDEEEQRQAARDYVAEFCKPDRPSIFPIMAGHLLSQPYREELYRCSRIAYCGQE